MDRFNFSYFFHAGHVNVISSDPLASMICTVHNGTLVSPRSNCISRGRIKKIWAAAQNWLLPHKIVFKVQACTQLKSGFGGFETRLKFIKLGLWFLILKTLTLFQVLHSTLLIRLRFQKYIDVNRLVLLTLWRLFLKCILCILEGNIPRVSTFVISKNRSREKFKNIS